MTALLASLDRRSEDVRVLFAVVTELELSNIERHIFAAHFVKRADHAALEDRPEAFDGLRVDCANDVLAPAWSMTPCGYSPSRHLYPVH